MSAVFQILKNQKLFWRHDHENAEKRENWREAIRQEFRSMNDQVVREKIKGHVD